MIWIAVVLGTFLFYRFVEKKHKTLIFKISGGLFFAGAVLVGGLHSYETFSESNRKNGITVELSYKDLKFTKATTNKMVAETYAKLLPQVAQYYPNVAPKVLGKIKEQLFYSYLDVKDEREFALLFPDDEFEALFHWIENKNAESESRLRKYESDRLKAWLGDLPKRRQKATAPDQKFLHIAYLNRAKDSFSFDDLKKEFSENLTQDEKKGIETFINLKEIANDELYLAINSRKDLNSIFSFKVCNKRDHPLEKYFFSVSGYDRGRSTANAIQKGGDYGSSTYFRGDIIIEPNKCSEIQWTGNYKFYNRYEISGVYGTWKN